MPATQGGGGGKILAVVGGAIALGVVIGVGCVLARGSGGPTKSEEAVHKDLLHHAEDSRSRLVVMTSPQPTEQGHHERGHQAEENQTEDNQAKENQAKDNQAKQQHEKEHPTQEHRNETRLHMHHHTNETRHQGHNRTNATRHHGHNRTNETRHGHNRTNETRHGYNRTNETRHGHNRTNETRHHGHKHKHCSGGSLTACKCMLKCEVFGGDASKCEGHSSNETKQLVDSLILKTMLSHRNMCDGMRCITECAEALGCLDDKVLDDCRIIRKSYAESNSDADPECDLHCSS
uniref:Uncharacterized protein n=1 Tax=Alexandrium monilatum TaxID=311494 RepID=A0A7S4W1N7_9DINO